MPALLVQILKRSGLCAASLLVFLFPSLGWGTEDCRPHHHPDGDTFHYRNVQGVEVKVRVAGFDAPERGQPYSRVATERMRSLTAGGAQCDCYKNDRYGCHRPA